MYIYDVEVKKMMCIICVKKLLLVVEDIYNNSFDGEGREINNILFVKIY